MSIAGPLMMFNPESRADCSNLFSVNITSYAGTSLTDFGPVLILYMEATAAKHQCTSATI